MGKKISASVKKKSLEMMGLRRKVAGEFQSF
jgi:hypothetical protein